jgi:hypothetical protein
VTSKRPGGMVDIYKPEITQKLYALAKALGFYVLYPDFEGVLAEGGNSQLLKEADDLYGKNKVLKGRYLAEKIDKIPQILEN